MLEDYEGAFHSVDYMVRNFKRSPSTLLERGVVKEMMEDYKGAKMDLDEA
jgi:hypothetical protein